ncbi:MAG: AAA family ATPase [Acidimicrobiia bacterium]
MNVHDVRLAAVLFCDVVGSTAERVRLGDARADERRTRFDALLCDVVDETGGRVVKGLGDGAMAAFDAPSAAISAAVALQQRVRRQSQDEAGAWRDLKIGISMGEVTTAADGDLFGTAVVEAARLCAAAAGGQVLVGAMAAQLARRGGARLEAVAPVSAKGFPEPIEAFEIAWEQPDGVAAVALPLPAALSTKPLFPFVARPAEWQQLAKAWDAVRDGGRNIVLVRGEPGAGKTRLVTEFARQIVAEGGIVLFGACREDGGPPFGAIVDALEHLLAHARELDLDEATTQRVLASTLLEEPDGGPSPADDVGHDPRATFFVAIGDLLVEAGRSAPVLLVLDDLQWARRPTLQLVGHLLRSPSRVRLCILATHRDTPADADDAFTDALADLHRVEGTARVHVRGLDDSGVRAFVELAAGADLGAALEQAVAVLARQTDGNPFLLGELWHHLVDMGALVPADGGWRVTAGLDALTTPESVRSVVGRRIDRLPADARELLEVAAVAGSPFGVDLLAGATNTSAVRVLELLEPAIASGTVEQVGAATFRFAHELVESALYDRLAPARKASAHFDLASAIERHGVSDRTLPDLARHSIAAIPIVDVPDAIAVTTRAADAAMRAYAYEDAVELLNSVLPFVDAAADRAELLLRVAKAEIPAGEIERSREHLRTAIDLARSVDHYDLVLRAALSFEESGWRLGLPGDEAERLLREAMPYAADESTRLRALAARGRALALSGDPAAENVIDQAIREARAHGDDRLLQFALVTWFNVGLYPEKYPSMLDRVTELRALSARTDDIANAMHAEHWRTLALMLTAQFGEIAETAAECSRLARLSGDPFHGHLSAALHSTLALFDGRFADAERLAVEASEHAELLSGAEQSGAYGVQMFSLRREQGRLEEVRPVVEAIVRLGRAHATWRPGLAAVYAELGMLDEARAEVKLLVAPGLPRVPRDGLYQASLSYLADAAVALGDRTAATTLYAALEPFRNSLVVGGHVIACYGSADRYLGALAEVAGRARDAERHYVRAIEIDTASGSPTWLAHSNLRYARFLARQGRRDAPERARELLEGVIESARAIGMVVVERRAAELLDELADVAVPEPVADDGLAAALTGREREILDCLVDGLSNAAIGRRLHISPNTAANHVRAILLKTGCANRTEAATWAVRMGLVSG